MAKCYIYEIQTTAGKRYGLAHAANGRVFHNGAEWKTKKGAENYARKHGHEIINIEKMED